MMAYQVGSSDFRYMKRQGFHLLRTRKGRKICHFGRFKRAVKKVEKTFWFCDLFIFESQCIYSSNSSKRDAKL